VGKKLRRPTKEMMLAVNAQIDGDTEEVGRLVQEHKLDQKEIQQRVQTRDGEKYSFEVKPRGQRKAKASSSDDILSIIDGRTPLVTVLRIEERAKEILSRKDKTEVTKVKKAMAEVDELRKKYEDAKALLGE